MSAPTSRLATYMCDRLGHHNWKAFVKHANTHYKDTYVRAFVEQPHVCVGPLDGAGCPHAFRVDLDSPEAGRMLGHLHLDHNHPVHQTCSEWSEKLPLQPQSWDDCVNGQKLCHLLFGVPDVRPHEPALLPAIPMWAPPQVWQIIAIRTAQVLPHVIKCGSLAFVGGVG